MSLLQTSSRLVRRGALTAVLIAATGVLASACGSTSTSNATANTSSSSSTSTAGPASHAPYRVLYIGPFSGPLAAVGGVEFAGLKAAATYINSQGGILGHRVQITTMDDQGTGTKAVSDGQQALSNISQYSMIYAGTFGQDSIPLAAVFAKTPTLQFGALPPTILQTGKYPNQFLAGSLTNAPEVGLATEMKSKGITRFAIVTGDDATGQTGAKDLQAAAKSAGLTVTATEFVPDAAVDATSQVQGALASHPQALAVNNFTPVIGAILKARSKLGSTLPLYGDVYFSVFNFGLITTPAERKGVTFETYPFMVSGTPVQATPAWKAFQKLVLSLDPKPALSLYAPVTLWDALMEARAAAVKAGTITGSAAVTALAGITSASQVPGFFGPSQVTSPNVHAWSVSQSDWDFVPAGVQKQGIISPGT